MERYYYITQNIIELLVSNSLNTIQPFLWSLGCFDFVRAEDHLQALIVSQKLRHFLFFLFNLLLQHQFCSGFALFTCLWLFSVGFCYFDFSVWVFGDRQICSTWFPRLLQLKFALSLRVFALHEKLIGADASYYQIDMQDNKLCEE